MSKLKFPPFFTIQEGKSIIPSKIICTYMRMDNGGTTDPVLSVIARSSDGAEEIAFTATLDQTADFSMAVIDTDSLTNTADLIVTIENSENLAKLYGIDLVFGQQTAVDKTPSLGSELGTGT
jgi:hypothetical protein